MFCFDFYEDTRPNILSPEAQIRIRVCQHFSLIKPCAKFKSSQLSSRFLSLMLATLWGYRHEALTVCSGVSALAGCHLNLSFGSYWVSARSEWKADMCSCEPALQKSFTAALETNWQDSHSSKTWSSLCDPTTWVWDLFESLAQSESVFYLS